MRLCSSALCLSLLLAVGCRDVRGLFALGADLKQEYPESQVSVSLTDGLLLTLTVADSGLAVASCERQASMAARMASFVRNNYSGFDSLQMVSIALTPLRSRAGTAAGVTGLPFRFAPTLLSAGLTPADSTRAVESCRIWRELQ